MKLFKMMKKLQTHQLPGDSRNYMPPILAPFLLHLVIAELNERLLN